MCGVKSKKALSFILAFMLFLLIFSVFPASAATKTHKIEEIYMYVDLHDDMYVITRQTPEDDPVFAALGYTKASKMEEMRLSSIYLIAESADHTYTVTVQMEKDEQSTENIDYSLLDDTALAAVKTRLLNGKSQVYKSCELKKYDEAYFFEMPFELTVSGTKLYCAQSHTVKNGQNINIVIQKKNEPLTKEQYQILTNIEKSAAFDTKSPSESSPFATIALVMGIILVLSATAVITYRIISKNRSGYDTKYRNFDSFNKTRDQDLAASQEFDDLDDFLGTAKRSAQDSSYGRQASTAVVSRPRPPQSAGAGSREREPLKGVQRNMPSRGGYQKQRKKVPVSIKIKYFVINVKALFSGSKKADNRPPLQEQRPKDGGSYKNYDIFDDR